MLPNTLTKYMCTLINNDSSSEWIKIKQRTKTISLINGLGAWLKCEEH